jgi:hypothetical protein
MASSIALITKSTESEESLAVTHEKKGIFTANGAYSLGHVAQVLSESEIYTEDKTSAGIEQWTYWKPREE